MATERPTRLTVEPFDHAAQDRSFEEGFARPIVDSGFRKRVFSRETAQERHERNQEYFRQQGVLAAAKVTAPNVGLEQRLSHLPPEEFERVKALVEAEQSSRLETDYLAMGADGREALATDNAEAMADAAVEGYEYTDWDGAAA